MAGSYRGSAKRTGSDSIASRKSPTVGDVLSRSNSYNDPKESDLEEVMADLMSNDLPFSDLVVSQAYLRTHGGEPLAHDPSTLRQEDPLIAAGSSGSEASAQSGQAGREQRKKEQNRKAQRAFRERKEQIMKTQNDEIAQLQRELERANNANESMRDELEQLKGEASGTAPPGRGSHGTVSPEGGSPSVESERDVPPTDRRSQ